MMRLSRQLYPGEGEGQIERRVLKAEDEKGEEKRGEWRRRKNVNEMRFEEGH